MSPKLQTRNLNAACARHGRFSIARRRTMAAGNRNFSTGHPLPKWEKGYRQIVAMRRVMLWLTGMNW